MDLKEVMWDHTSKMMAFRNDKLKFYEKYVRCPIFVTKEDVRLNPSNDPYYRQIWNQAIIDGISIREWFPNYIGTRDFKGNRLNIHFKKINEHLYEIEKIRFG